MNYKSKLSNPKWQKRRLEICNRDNWQCQICFKTEKTLTVHHKEYIKNKDIWDYPDDMLITICLYCHDKLHEIINEKENGVIYSMAKGLKCNFTDLYIFIARLTVLLKQQGIKTGINTAIQLLTAQIIKENEI